MDELLPVPPRPAIRKDNGDNNTVAVEQYFLQNRDWMKREYQELTREAFFRRWDLKEVTWNNLCARGFLTLPIVKKVMRVNQRDGVEVPLEMLVMLDEKTEKPQIRNLPPVPVRPSSRAPNIVSRYFDDNAKQILKEREIIGEMEVRERWGFSVGAWLHFAKRHSIPLLKRRGRYKKRTSIKEVITDGGSTLQKIAFFPLFNEGWSDNVKVSWLTNFVELERVRAGLPPVGEEK